MGVGVGVGAGVAVGVTVGVGVEVGSIVAVAVGVAVGSTAVGVTAASSLAVSFDEPQAAKSSRADMKTPMANGHGKREGKVGRLFIS